MKEATKLWLEYAQRDITAAKQLLANDEIMTNVVCYHCQQAVEKMFKAVLIENELSFPKIHNVVTLYEKCKSQTLCNFTFSWEELNDINDVYSETRYPSEIGLLPHGFPSKEDAERFYEIAERVVNATIKCLKE